MSDYISREDAVDELQVKVFHNLTDEYYGTMQVLNELPAADVAPVVHGMWSYRGNHRSGLKVCECSNCKKRAFGSTAYCPNCGAKMDEGDEHG